MKNHNHKLYDIWNKVPPDYYQKGTKKNIFQKIWHGLKIRSVKRIIKDYKFNNCLDIGCASGYMLSQIAQVYPHAKYYGVDVYDKAIIYAKKKYPNINFKISSADNLPFKDETFDVIIFYETIEHIENPIRSLKEVRRVLNKDGVLILAMDSGNRLFRLIWFIWENTRGKVWKGAHLHPFHHTELEEIIKRAAFKIKDKFFTHLGMEVTFVLKK